MNKRLLKWVLKWLGLTGTMFSGTFFLAIAPVWADPAYGEGSVPEYQALTLLQSGHPTLLAATSSESRGEGGFAVNAAGADPGAGAGVSQALSSSEMSKGLFATSNVYIDYFGDFHGSDLSQFGKPYQADRNGNTTYQPMYFDSEMTTAYLVTPNIGVGLDFEFAYTPVLGQDVTMEYIGFKAMDRKTIYKNGFTLYTNLILQIPTTDYDHNRNVFLGVKSTPYIRYQIPHTRFTLGSWNEVKDYAGATDGKMYKLYAEPYVNYQIAPGFSLNLGYEIEADHYAASSGMSLYESDVQPGFVVNITRTVILNPYLQFFTTNKVTMDTTAFGMVVTARIL